MCACLSIMPPKGRSLVSLAQCTLSSGWCVGGSEASWTMHMKPDGGTWALTPQSIMSALMLVIPYADQRAAGVMCSTPRPRPHLVRFHFHTLSFADWLMLG